MPKEINKIKIKKDLSALLYSHKEVLFALLHGSFNNKEKFNDIDLAVFIKEKVGSVLLYELNLEAELIKSGLFPRETDIRVLNNAPLYFQYNVIKNGSLLFSRNQNAFTDFKEIVIRDYLDFLPHYNEYLKETLNFEI
jgi:uncharacterized protein